MAKIVAHYSSKVPEGTAVCMPSQTQVDLRTKYEIPEGTSAMVFNPKNIPDISAAIGQ